MSVEKTPRACISTGTILSPFGKPLLYFLVCGVVDRPHQYHDLFSQAPPKLFYLFLHDYLGLAHRACYITSLRRLSAYDGCLSVRLYLRIS
jgi:hypothetical protein